ncbi:DUF2089 family protein [Fructilactobacillus vespulae]|uniref:DUF2089 family protein n=1 Tax=Fructilactobacillus vespulae TaxID=1249630 RepID=UPI0039B6DEC3
MDWFLTLTEDDQNFAKQIILKSGSLKDLAQHYEVSYPTLRQRLNQLIDKIVATEQKQKDNFEPHIMQQVINGNMDLDVAKDLIGYYHKISR